MALEALSNLAPEQLADLISFVKGVIGALGGLITIYLIVLIWKFIITRKNNKLLLGMQNDMNKIKKKLRIK